ncbi:MAG: DUF371 domain-containing protein [Candidatus Aenigmarchaeota archaeon]|nr:DUF371 domain-containing protein [Candidatus Aenigmarchaeota archaeon]
MITETFFVYGHENVRSTHKSTLEFTKDKDLGLNGDCILGVGSDYGCADFSSEFKDAVKDENAKVAINIEMDGVVDTVSGFGHPDISLTDANEIVIRKSDFVCGRTLCVNSDKAAKDIDARIIDLLKKTGSRAKVTVTIS